MSPCTAPRVLGGLRPDSDLDVLVVVRRSLVQQERLDLLNALLDISGRRARREPGRPVELTVVVHEDVNPWRYRPTVDFQYGEWLRQDDENAVVPAPHSEPDLAMLITMTRMATRHSTDRLPRPYCQRFHTEGREGGECSRRPANC